jgi:hypothetical protein
MNPYYGKNSTPLYAARHAFSGRTDFEYRQESVFTEDFLRYQDNASKTAFADTQQTGLACYFSLTLTPYVKTRAKQ